MTEPIEQFFLIFYEHQSPLPSKHDVLAFFQHHFTTDVSKILQDAHDGYGANLISLLIDSYHDFDLILEIHTIVQSITNNVEELFWITESHSWNSEHPVDHIYLLGLEQVFQLINTVYARKFNMMYDVCDQTDPSCILEYVLSHDNLRDELKALLKAYNVKTDEFDYELIY